MRSAIITAWTLSSALLMATACNQGAKQPERAPGERAAKAIALAKAADQALADSVRLDYRRPAVGEPLRRDNVRKAYWEACQAGDHRSCWLASSVRDQIAAGPEVLPDTQKPVREACQHGDKMSCRALPDSTSIGQPGSGAAIARQREGCRAGLVSECEALYAITGTQLADALHDRTVDLVQVKADMALSGSMLCTLRLECDELWVAYSENDRDQARDAAERACQFGKSIKQRRAACTTLVSQYTPSEEPRPTWPEPVPGRAEALRAWLDKHAGDKTDQ